MEKILTLHPQGKAGVNISRNKYDHVRRVIELVVSENPNITFSEMADISKEILKKESFDGKPLWYITTVKLDLEARGILERVPKTSPHQLVLSN